MSKSHRTDCWFPGALSLGWLTATTPEPMDFVMPGFRAGTVGALIAPGGLGKSMFALQVALEIATGHPLTGLGLKPGKVLYFSAEDDDSALHHRVSALHSHFCLSDQEIERGEENLELCSLEGRLDITGSGWVRGLTEEMPSDFRLVVLDTFRRFHLGEENSSSAMKDVLGVVERVAQRGPAVLLLHHASKASSSKGGRTQQAGRGSSVISDHVRFQAYLSPVNDEEAEDNDLDDTDRNNVVTYGVSKLNYAARPSPVLFERGPGGVLIPPLFKKQVKKPRRQRGKVTHAHRL